MPIKLFFLTSQIRAGIAVGFNALLFTLGPGLNGLLTHKAEFLEDALFNFIGYVGITSSVLNDIENGIELACSSG